MAPSDKNELGRLLKRARKDAGYSNAHEFLAAVKEEQGAAPSYSSYAQWESGEVGPRDGSLATIEAFHRKRNTWTEPAGAPDLATALLALAQELGALRTERQQLVARVDELEATVALLVERSPAGQGSAAQAARVVPRESAGSGR